MSTTSKIRNAFGGSSTRPKKSLYKKIKKTQSTTASESETGGSPTSSVTSLGSVSVLSSKPSSGSLAKGRKILPEFTPEEHQFMNGVLSGNVTEVSELLDTNENGTMFIKSSNIDVNKANLDGYNALQIAVQREDEDMVELLLKIKGIDISDTLFLAIKEDSMGLVKMIVEFEAKKSGHDISNPDKAKKLAIARCKAKKDAMTNSEFEEDVTSLILAAHTGSFQLIEYFFSIGERLPVKPSMQREKSNQIMKESFVRLRWYKAICNPYYISFMANEDSKLDPVLQAFNLVDEVRTIARNEPEFKTEYETLVSDLIQFTGDLLDLCRTTEEVDLVCSQKEGFVGHPNKISRLTLAVQHEQIDFVVHSFAQDILKKRWIRDWHSWSTFGIWTRSGILLLYIIGWPFLSIWLLLTYCFDASEIFRSPVSRFLNSMGSYVTFLMLLVLECYLPYDKHDVSPPRTLALSIVHWTVVAFVLGHIISISKQICFMPRQYFKMRWNLYEVLNQFMFVITFSLWLWAWVNAPDKENISRSKFGNRKFWPKYSPLLISECFFAIATIMSFGRLLRIFQLHSRFGPLQIALGYMIRDFGMGAVFYGITIFSFASGMAMLYKSYHEMYDEDDHGTRISQSEQYTSFWAAFQALFWGLFNMSPTDGSDIVEVHGGRRLLAVNPRGNSSIVFHPHLTQWTGKFIIKTFQVLNVLMFANTIVSMMANTAGAVFENKNREWKFARTQVRLFFGSETRVPAPFNIIGLLVGLGAQFCGEKGKAYNSGCSLTRCFYRDEITVIDDRTRRTDYAILVKRLLQRYFRNKTEAGLDDPATAAQVTRIREDVAEMKQKSKAINSQVIFQLTGKIEQRRSGKKPQPKRPSLDSQFSKKKTAYSKNVMIGL